MFPSEAELCSKLKLKQQATTNITHFCKNKQKCFLGGEAEDPWKASIEKQLKRSPCNHESKTQWAAVAWNPFIRIAMILQRKTQIKNFQFKLPTWKKWNWIILIESHLNNGHPSYWKTSLFANLSTCICIRRPWNVVKSSRKLASTQSD